MTTPTAKAVFTVRGVATNKKPRTETPSATLTARVSVRKDEGPRDTSDESRSD